MVKEFKIFRKMTPTFIYLAPLLFLSLIISFVLLPLSSKQKNSRSIKIHIIKKIIISIIFVLAYSSAYSQFTQEWSASCRFRGSALAIDSSGNLIVTGFRDSVICTVKYSSSGQKIWERDTAIFPNGQGIHNAIDRFGNVYISLADISSRLQLIKYDSSGLLKWNNLYLNQANQCVGIALDTAGNIFVTCESFVGRYEYLTVKYNPAGNVDWERRYSGNYGARTPSSICVDISGNVYVTGSDNVDPIRHVDYATIKYNNNGDQLWISQYNGRISSYDQPYSVCVDKNGYCYVTGTSDYTLSRASYCTIKYNSSGDSVWTRLYPTDTIGELYSRWGSFVFADSPGNVYVAGWKYIIGSSDGWAITAMKYDSNGNMKWYRVDSAAMYSRSAVLDKNNNFFLIGDGRGKMKGVGYDSQGNKIWDFPHPKNTYNARKILCNRNGDLYVLSSSLDTAMLFKFSQPTIVRNENTGLINDYKLYQNYPNPFNPTTTIKFQCSIRSNVTLKIYDIIGREIQTPVNEKLNAGTYIVRFNGEGLSTGIYFYSLYINDNLINTKHMIMIK